jgi:DNA anti-recombination protein RmuC
MKKITTIINTTLFLACLSLASCTSAEKKVDKAEERVADAAEEMKDATADYHTEVANYKTESAQRFSENEQAALNFKARIDNEKKEARTEYYEKISVLEKRNSDMKLKLENYRADSQDSWKTFKEEFNHDMDELGKSFHDLTVNNVK